MNISTTASVKNGEQDGSAEETSQSSSPLDAHLAVVHRCVLLLVDIVEFGANSLLRFTATLHGDL